MYQIQTLNNISSKGLAIFSHDQYEIGPDLSSPDAIMLRSFDLHSHDVGNGVVAIARAGVGVNNIPVAQFSKRGIPIFNSPGANANAVKELVLTGMLMASRNIPAALQFVAGLSGSNDDIHTTVESQKKQFVGAELAGRTLGVIGLGAIGVRVANAAMSLDMQVVGFDPGLTVGHAWDLSAGVKSASSVDDVLRQADFVTIHVPLTDDTRDLIDHHRLKVMRNDATLLNFSREGVVITEDVVKALQQKTLGCYVSDFPQAELIGLERVITLPHLGASTVDAEENCAMMVARNLQDYLENGNVKTSVNFPDCHMPRNGGPRLAIANANVPNMVAQISTILAGGGFNIKDLLNKSRGDLAYTILDVDKAVDGDTVAKIQEIEGVLLVRVV